MKPMSRNGLDPACGSGNFLIVAYRELRQLELDILIRLQELGDTSATPTLYFERSDLAVKLTNIAGIEIEEWSAQIARTALRLVDHQANMAMEAALGKAPDTLPLDTVQIIHVGNALRMDWSAVMPPQPGLMVVGNPPFPGHATRRPEQADELRDVWGRKDIGGLDYVTGWFKKSIDYLGQTPGVRFAFVSTNSIAQGEPVPTLFAPIFEADWRIRCAHQTFAWTSKAAGAAAVHCVITGFDREPRTPAKLYTYASLTGEPTEVYVSTQINAYLTEGANVLVEQRRDVLGAGIPTVSMGSMPRDGGNLLINTGKECNEVCADPIAAKYVRPFLMGKEFINGIERWCLWLLDLDPGDVSRSLILRERLTEVAEMRRESSAKSTQEMAATPHLFGQRSQPDVPYLALPSVFAARRTWATLDRRSASVITRNKIYRCEDPDGYAFAVASSSMFIAWQKGIGGRLKSDPNFSNTLVWNNLPLPPANDALREQIIEAGRGVLDARALHPERSLDDHYNPLAMAPELLKAHAALDRVVDRAFGATSALRGNEEPLQLLFERYAELTQKSQ